MGWTMILKDDCGVIAWTWRTGSHLPLLFLLSLVSTQVKPDMEFHKDHHFSWKTGQWGPCIGEECGSDGIQTRTVWCVHSEGWTTHHSHCLHSDKPESQRRCFKVCEWHQDLFEWELSDWGSCVLVPFFSNELKLRTGDCVTAQHGIQRRKVTCVRTSNRTAVTMRICEFFSQRPAGEQACLIPCPQDCVVSDFTSWSGCSKTCGVGLQHRTRHVLATPMYGGANCPNLTQTRACSNPAACPVGESEHRYSLKVGPWSKCRLPHHKGVLLSGRTTVDFTSGSQEKNTVKRHTQAPYHHQHQHHHHPPPPTPRASRYPMSWELEVGHQTRQVRCTRSDGRNAMLSLCTREKSPLTFQACVMPKDCDTSDWSAWSPCSKTCHASDLSPGYRLRTRMMTQIPVGGGERCPALEEKEACNIMGDLLPNCPRYAWRTTDWGECRIAPLLSQQDRRLGNISILCGGGIQTRETYCVQVPDDSAAHHKREVSRPVSTALCAGLEPPSAVQPCTVSCSHDCLLSPWSSWGACLHDHCKELQGRKGFKQRRRQVLWEPGGPPESCAHLVEAIPCEDPECYRWQVQPAATCTPTQGACGPGIRVQNVTCVTVEGTEVSSSQCVGERPPAQGSCEVACPGGCVVGPWSSWSSCSHSCAAKNAEGRQSRTRHVLALPANGGKECPTAPALEDWRVCNDHPCMVFYWEASAWGPCIEDASMNLNGTSFWNGTAACAVGVQIRKINCMKKNTGQVVSKRCPDSARPETVRPCLLPCKKDCIVTPFSEWTACPSNCMPANATVATQSRYRTVIQRSANGGQECPDTLFEERECEPLPVCPVYRWKTHKWHTCTLVPDSVRQGMAGPADLCGDGLETRGASCVGEDGEPADMTECLQWAGALPSLSRGCRVACKDDCTLTAWSRFSECTGCGSSRSRKRSLTGRSKKRERCLNEELYPLVETEPCPCDGFLSQPYGNWSSCIIPSPLAAEALQGWRSRWEVKECGQGLRYRAVACVDQQSHLHNPTLCTDSGYMVEVCHITCPLDCKLSDWSAWSACSASCGSGLKVRSKWLREKAFNGGRPCPKLDLKNQVYEAVPCHSECGQYEWKTEPWSICTINLVNELPACGEGVQSRKIRCVKREAEGGEASSVDDSLCDPEDMPPRAQVCSLPCPEDCVVSPWGPWSNCPMPCLQGTSRSRTRHVLRLPASEVSACPELVQSEPCILNSTCFTYQYTYSDWSTCQLSENAICGPGSRSRLLDCVRSDGKVVERSVCEQLGLVNEQKLLGSCVVNCPVNCVLSDWSAWAKCSHTCGSQGQTMRSRRILQQAHELGRPCPAQLTQTKPCPIQPCYTWLLSDWSPCTVEGAECGEGLRRRNLTCMVHRGDWPDSTTPKPVEEQLCGDKIVKQSQQELELPCFVPCPGDCHLTEWSLWSSCQLTCLEGRSFETTGRQARSRSVVIQVMENQENCPHQVFETQSCKEGKCHSYEWRTGGWSDNQRTVWCQRSDGVNVTGGCFQQNRPTTIRHCHPPCTKPFSHCTPSGVCGCEKGYTEVMTTHGFLDYCTRTPGADNKKADVKTNSGRVKPGPSQAQDFLSEWTFRPVGPDGRLKLWVYGVTAVGFILILFIIALSFLVCKPSKMAKTASPPQKPLTLAYDGDVDM
ncbi:thrombospondin type-1 domain-containing protein 7B [Lampris incognitus]|uniref:thrombospondin type-1 domain-containing protein 7B n=1 Tax=Lampris incognitus TaxID=2546036 RepID=UPI0024B5F33A|nr:thrombospondin type-1 domain-containing protein 7B [Lampris incognitus]